MHSENMAKNRHECCQIAKIFVYNLWKSIIVDLEKSGNFFLLLCGHPVKGRRRKGKWHLNFIFKPDEPRLWRVQMFAPLVWVMCPPHFTIKLNYLLYYHSSYCCDVVSTRVQSVRIVCYWLYCTPVSTPVWYRQGCLCSALCQKYSHNFSTFTARCSKWKGGCCTYLHRMQVLIQCAVNR